MYGCSATLSLIVWWILAVEFIGLYQLEGELVEPEGARGSSEMRHLCLFRLF